MFKTILQRAITWELVRVFSLSLLGITGMLLMAGIVAEASQHGLTPVQILAAIPLLVPSTLPYTLPATTLFATCVVYGRLAHDNEILAIKAAGINVLSVIWPAVLLGLAVTGFTFCLYYSLIPSTHFMLRSLVIQDIEEFLYAVLKRERCIHHPKLNYTMHVHSVQGRKLIDAIFERKDPSTGAINVTARADEAELVVSLHHKMIRVHLKRCNISSNREGDTGYFQESVQEVPLPPDFDKTARKFRAGDMTWAELLENREDLRQQKQRLDADITLLKSLDQASDSKAPPSPQVANLEYAAQQKQNEIRSMETELMMRPALSLGCLFFVVIGCPVGIWFSKSDYLSAFITCFIPIVLVYYPLLLCGSNLAKTGRLHPALAVWGANVLMGMVALPLYRKLMKT